MRPKSKIWLHFSASGIGKSRCESHGTCKYCKAVFKSNTTRMQKHLVKDCKSCPENIKQEFSGGVLKSCFGTGTPMPLVTSETSSVDHVNKTRPTTSGSGVQLSSDEDDMLLIEESNIAHSSCSSMSSVHSNSKPKASTPAKAKSQSALVPMKMTFHDVVTKREQENLDVCFAKAVYGTAMAFSAFNNPLWLEFFKQIRPAWSPPTAHKISNALLDKWDGIISTNNAKLLTEAESLVLLSDGWSCIERDSHIQFLASTPAPLFLKSVHPGANRHTAEYIAAQCDDVMNSEGVKPEMFSGVCTDHASNMIAAWRILQEKYTWIQCYGGSAHAFDLVVHDLQQIPSILVCMAENQAISKFFRNHQIPKAVLQEYCVSLLKKPLVCLIQVATRWSSGVRMLSRNIRLQDCLKLTVCDGRCGNGSTNKLQKKFQKIKELVMDEHFWERSKFAEELLIPFKHCINEVEADSCRVSVIPNVWSFAEVSAESLLQKYSLENIVTNDEKSMVAESILNRKDFTVRPVHKAANLLDPRFQGHVLNEEAVSVAEDTIIKLAGDRGFPTDKVIKDLMEYKSHGGEIFGRHHIWNVANDLNLDPVMWWKANGGMRFLASVARILLSFPTSIASVERANKEYSLQKTRKRNRLTDERSAKVTKIAYNIKVQERENKPPRFNKVHTALVVPEQEQLKV